MKPPIGLASLPPGDTGRSFPLFSSLIVRWQRPVEFLMGGLLVGYIFYVLMLSKVFAPSIDPAWFRDLGILWWLSDHLFEKGHYAVGNYFFPPTNAIIVHVYGLMNRELAFRIYVVIQAASFVLLLWMWCRFLEIDKRADRSVIVLVAFLASSRYVHFEFHMHNVNLITLALVSAAVIFHRSPASGFSYALSLAVKPYSSVLVLPWMLWQGYFRWVAYATIWLFALFVLLPAAWFGLSDAIAFTRDWLQSMAGAGIGYSAPLSVKLGISALMGMPPSDTLVGRVDAIALGLWLLAVAAFFVPTLMRRGPCPARAMAAELAGILVVLLPVGSLQQPARGVVLLVAMMVIAAALFRDEQGRRSRIVLIVVLAFVGISTHAIPMGPLHYLLTLPVCMATLAGLAIARGAAMKAKSIA